MAKNISSAVLASQSQFVSTLATILKIVRQDGITYRLTNHDTDLVFNGETYSHNIPFVLSAISAGSQLAIDNMDLTLSIDEETFKLGDFRRKAFQHAEVEITEVDYTNPSIGGMTLRKGWIGAFKLGEYGVAEITIVGLLKVLDIEVGRVYQPSCDADLGDSRCKVAINFNQVRDYRDTFRTGDWRYIFNPAGANEITLVNPSFEDDGDVAYTDPITGWTKVPALARLIVEEPNIADLDDAPDGTRVLVGESDTGETDRAEAYVYQDVDLVTAGIDSADIDDGRISLAYFADLAQPEYLLDPVKISCQIYNADGEIIYIHDTGWLKLDTFDVWRRRQLVFPLLSGARSVRLSIGFKRFDGQVFNGAADNVHLYWWDHIDGSPWDDVIHKVVRIANLSNEGYAKYPTNDGFESAAATNNDAQNITGWTKAAGSFWGVAGTVHGVGTPAAGSRLLVAGDDLSGTQQTYEIAQTINLVTTWKLSAARIALGALVGRLFYSVVWGDTESAAQVSIEWYDVSDTLISSTILMDFTTQPAPTGENLSSNFVIPATARSLKIILRAQSPVADSLAMIGFDAIRAGIIDALIVDKQDPISSTGAESTVFSTTSGSYTFDGNLVWRASSHHVQYDAVATVTDRKQFTGSDITGVAGAYETGVIMWVSGANRGQKNLIRVWNPDTKAIKLYFESVNPIQVGDRFQYIRSCQKRFNEDCQLRYDNVINFRGFPHLPGRVSD